MCKLKINFILINFLQKWHFENCHISDLFLHHVLSTKMKGSNEKRIAYLHLPTFTFKGFNFCTAKFLSFFESESYEKFHWNAVIVGDCNSSDAMIKIEPVQTHYRNSSKKQQLYTN